ncbi:hypothetical protein ABFS82_14G218900 [Erythranthe guttata]|uniref:putative NAD kinase 3 isoform X1 n=1 Tax=Erythranthe guttata TaxID=4155 RepID=UPI00064D911D|nr:PREDICTED: putative NAD kinase 3 isoform X1 [Erythranthe guttata]|eukprot:XP_012844668.1 PREDICTED: putative NAD kinase 3 isoform X1 [Erythranthe guttata]
MAASSSTSTTGNAEVSQTDNGLIDSEKTIREIIQQPLLLENDDPLIEFSEALETVVKTLRRVTEAKASAQAEAAEWKRKYELERARNLQLEQKESKLLACSSMLSLGGRCSELNVEKGREPTEQTMFSDENRMQCELGGGEEGICSHLVLKNDGPDIESYAAQNKVMGKASFKLSWYCKGEKSDSHKHDIVSFEKGNITTAERSSKQICLTWESPPQTVLVATKPNSAPVRKACLEMVRWLKEHKNLNVFVEPRIKAELLEESSYYSFVQTWRDEDMPLLHTKVDLVLTLGGDGTVLWTASMFKGPVPPIVPFSLGSLGFMTTFSKDHFDKDLSSVLVGPVNIMLRHRLQCHIIRRDAAKSEGPILVLNEVTIDRGVSPFLTYLKCYWDGTFVTDVQGDGLILSTTSGSTAYSVAAGGSMVHPQVPGILFTPICPHSLSFRPLMLPENVSVRVVVPVGSRSSAWVSFDGKGRKELAPGDAIVCSMSRCPVPIASQSDPTSDFLRSIKSLLKWNLRETQLSDGPRH